MYSKQGIPQIPERTCTWILIANRSGADLYESEIGLKNFHPRERIAHPEGRLKNGDVNTDREGMSVGDGGGKRATIHISQKFAKTLGTRLNQGRQQRRFQRLILVAEPKFLGQLRKTLDDETLNCVAATIDKELKQSNHKELREHLATILMNDDRRAHHA